jgi:hypothetical protein
LRRKELQLTVFVRHLSEYLEQKKLVNLETAWHHSLVRNVSTVELKMSADSIDLRFHDFARVAVQFIFRHSESNVAKLLSTCGNSSETHLSSFFPHTHVSSRSVGVILQSRLGCSWYVRFDGGEGRRRKWRGNRRVI